MKNVSVIGAGLMGSQIAMCAAIAGFKVHLHDVDENRLTSGQSQVFKQIEKYITKGRLSSEQFELAK